MTMKDFINENRAALVAVITRVTSHVPRTASCSCPKSGTDHYHSDGCRLSSSDIRQWILNDEGLYSWARSEGVRV